MSEEMWQILVLIFLFIIALSSFMLSMRINKLFPSFSSAKPSVSENIDSLTNEVRKLRWAILGGPDGYEDENPSGLTDDYYYTLYYGINRIKEDLRFIISEVTGESIIDLQDDNYEINS